MKDGAREGAEAELGEPFAGALGAMACLRAGDAQRRVAFLDSETLVHLAAAGSSLVADGFALLCPDHAPAVVGVADPVAVRSAVEACNLGTCPHGYCSFG